MQPASNPLQKAAEIFHKGTTGVICLAQNPSLDTVAAATTLYLGLTKLGKNVTLSCSTPKNYGLFAEDKINGLIETSGNNLVVSFPYEDGTIDKVDYYIQENTFNIVVKPVSDHPKLEPKDVKYFYTGGAVDFIVTVDADILKKLGPIYSDNQELFQGKNIINIDRHLTNSFYGQANLVNKNSSSTCELVLLLLKSLKCPLDSDIATNLYAGLVTATNNFTSYSVNPSTFETAAELLNLGASKKGAKQIFPERTIRLERTAQKPMGEIEKEQDEDLKPKIFRGPSDLS